MQDDGPQSTFPQGPTPLGLRMASASELKPLAKLLSHRLQPQTKTKTARQKQKGKAKAPVKWPGPVKFY